MPSAPTRRRLLGAAAALAVLPAAGATADPMALATIFADGGMVSGTARKPPWRLGFANGYAGNPWRAMCVAALQQEAATRRDRIASLAILDAHGDIAKQSSDINGLADQHVDAILCIPNSAAGATVALREATKTGIVTVPFNLPVEGEDWSSFAGTDPFKKGEALGAWLARALGGKGKIVALGGVPGNAYTAACWAGSQAVFHGTGIEVLATADGFWQEDRARAVMAELIAAHPQIDGVWCDGGQDATGACKALLAAGRKLVPVTGDDYNGLLKFYASMRATQPHFDIGLIAEPTWVSVVALRAALTLLVGGSVAKRQIILPGLITGANYQTYIRPTLPDAVFVDTTLDDATLARIFA